MNTYERYIEENPEEYQELLDEIDRWLQEKQKPYPKVSKIAREVTNTKTTRGGFKTPLVSQAIDDLDLKRHGSQRIQNPYAFNETTSKPKK